MATGALIIALGVFGAVFFGGYLIMLRSDRYEVSVAARMRDITHDTTASPKRRSAADEARPGARVGAQARWHSTLTRILFNQGEDRNQGQRRLLQAGIYSPAALSTLVVLRLACMVGPPLVALLAGWSGMGDTRLLLLCGCVAGGFGMILPSLWLDARVRKRHRILRRSLPDFLDLSVVCLESGLSLQASLQRVSDELRLAHPLLAGELSIVQRNVELGATIDASLRRFADRSGYEGIRTLSSFIRESQRFGTELVEALRSHADMLRTQREQLAEEIAQKASVKILIPTLLLIMPAVFVVVAGPAVIQVQQAFTK